MLPDLSFVFLCVLNCISNVQVAGREQISNAVKVTKAAYASGPLSKFTSGQRLVCILEFADLAHPKKKYRKLAIQESAATGKPLMDWINFDLLHTTSCYRCG